MYILYMIHIVYTHIYYMYAYTQGFVHDLCIAFHFSNTYLSYLKSALDAKVSSFTYVVKRNGAINAESGPTHVSTSKSKDSEDMSLFTSYPIICLVEYRTNKLPSLGKRSLTFKCT
jgi:hypothetical protein